MTIAGVTSGAGGAWAPPGRSLEEQKSPLAEAWRNRSLSQRVGKIIKERQVLLRLTSKFLWRISYNLQKGSHFI